MAVVPFTWLRDEISGATIGPSKSVGTGDIDWLAPVSIMIGSSLGCEEMYIDGKHDGEVSLYRKTVDLRQLA